MEARISLGNNIARIRKKHELTQEGLASFLGVTKASVSKWETGQSYPDIELLPRIATYFGITIDELVGYEPQLSKREIREIFERLTKAFAHEPFSKVHEECQSLVREYYCCYPLLVQIAALYLNHMDLADAESIPALMQEMTDLCQRVRNGSTSSVHIRQAESIEAYLLLARGNAQAAIELLADAARPDAGTDILLARAYNSLGQADKADETLQAMTLQALILNLNRLVDLALLHAADPDKLELIHERTLKLIEAFNLETCYVNIGATHLAFAIAYMVGSNTDKAIDCLEAYERACRALEFPVKLHGDEFFDRIDTWLEENNDIGTSAPRDEGLIKKNLLASVAQNPAFAPLTGDPRFKRIIKSLEAIVR